MGKLNLLLHEVHAIDETGSGWDEWGEDDIYLAAVTVASDSKVESVPAFKVGGFDDGDRKKYEPAKRLKRFRFPDDVKIHNFLAILVLIEKDSGDTMNEFLEDLEAETSEAMVRAKADAAASGGAAGTGDDSDVWGAILDVAVDLITAGIESAIENYHQDDIFPPKKLKVQVLAGRVDERQRTAIFRGHDGHYEVKYSWDVS